MLGVERMRNPSDEELLKTFTPPEFICPYPLKFNPHYSEGSNLRVRLNQWLLDLKLDEVFPAKMYEILLKMNMGSLPAKTFPEAGEWGLEFACKYFSMLWIWDDILDSTEVGRSAQTAVDHILHLHLILMWSFPDDPSLRTHLGSFLNVLALEERKQKIKLIDSVLVEARTQPGTVYPGNLGSNICDVFRDVWKMAVTHGSPISNLRLARGTQEWLLGVLMEVKLREEGKPPASIDEYIQIRKKSGAVSGTTALVDIIYGITTPDDFYYSSEMKRMVDAANDFSCWHNDVLSFKKEVLIQKQKSNLVLAISLYKNVSYMEAAEIVTKMMGDRVIEMEKAARNLEAETPPELKLSVKFHVAACRDFISGTMDWHNNNINIRYA